jgi:hypothetical protein
MLPAQTPKPWPFMFLNSASRLLETARLYPMVLEESAVSRAAVRMTGLTDFGNDYFREGLRSLLEALDGVPLHPIGRMAMYRFTIFNLANRLRFIDIQKRRPGILETRLQPPLIVTGLPRSGTTFLHRLLAMDPAHRAVPRNEMLPLLIPEEEASFGRWRLTINRQFRLWQWFMPDIDRKHYSRAEVPEECIWMLGLTFESTIYWVLAPVYGYMEWYRGHDRVHKYREYRIMLQLLQRADPRRLVLKAPEHTDGLDALFRAIPDVRVVQTHRDPVTVCSSFNSLLYTTHGAGATAMDVSRLAEANTRMLEAAIANNLAARANHPDAVYDVRYDRFTSDPIGTVRGIYEHFDMPMTGGYVERLKAYVSAHPQNEFGRHHYSAEDFGQSETDLAARFAAYRDRFGLAT